MLVCATLLPWQAPAAALAQENTDQTSAPAPVSDDDAAKAKPFNVDLAKPGARGEAIGKTLTERVDDLKNAKLAVDAAAALQDAFKKLAADAEQLHKDLDGLKAAGLSDGGTKLAAGAADAFAAPYALVKELTAEDFEMKALVARNAARAERFDKPQDTLTTDDWDAIAREAPQAGPESDRVDAYCQKQRAYGIPAEDPKKTAGEARAALCDQWSGPSQKLKGLHLAQLVKARPENTPGSAADDVLAPLRQTVLKRDPKLATDLGALNARLSQYLKTGDAGSLSSVLHDVESLDQKSGNTDVGARAALLEQIKQAAQTRAGPPQQAATIVFSAPQPRLTPDGGDVPSAAASTPAKPSATQSSAQLAQWQAKLAGAAAAGGPALAAAWAEFTKLFPQSMTADQFVKQLSGGVDVVSLVDRVAPLAAGLDARASALRFDADLAAFRAKTAALREQEASFAQSGQLPSQSAVDALDAELKRLQAAAPQERAAAIQSAAAEFRATAVEIGKRRLASESAERPLDKKLDDLLGRLQPAKPSEGTDLRREIDSALGDTSARAAEVALLRREYEAAKDGIAADARASLEAKLAQADDGVKKIAPAGLKRAFDAVAAEVRALVSAAPRKGASQAAINAWKAKWDAAVAALLGDSEAAEAAAGQWGRLDAEYKSWIGKSPSQQEQDDLKPSQGAAATMVALLKSMNEAMGRGELDITQWDDRYRQEILGKAASAVKVEDLGVFGQAFIQKGRVRDDASTLLRGLSGIKLTGDPAQDAAALDGFFDQSANKALLTDDVAAELPAPIRDYVLKRKAAAASGAPAAPALTPQAIADIQALQRLDRNEASKPSTQRVVTSLYLAYYDVARQAAAVLHCENYGKADVSIEQGRFRSEERASVPRAAAPEEPEGGEEGGQPQPKLSKPAAMTEAKKKEFCERFNGHSSLAAEVTPGELDFQRKLVDSVRPLLQDNDEARLSRASVETLRTMVAGLRGLDAQTKAALRKEGVDVDGIIRHEDQREIVSWTLTAGRLGPQDDRYRALRDDVLTSVYGQGYVDSVTAQSRKLKEAVGGAGADPAPVVAALDGLDNPAVLTRGFLARVAALGQSDRSKLSARDQAELAGWQMWKKVLDDRLAQPMPANFDAQKWGAINAEIQGARDSKDPAQLARALVWAGQPVFDAEMLRVGFDTTKVSAQPQSQDQVLDLQRVFILASVLEVKGDHRDPAVAAQIKAKLLEYLKTKVADGQVEARKQQLLESNNDEFTDRVRKLDAVVHTDAFKQLALAGQVRSYLDASTALDQMLTKAQSDPHLAASLAMSRAYGELQGRVGLSLRDAYAPDKLTVSGWIMGTEGEVSRERNYASHGVPNGTTTPKDHDGVIASQMGRGFHVPLDAPTARKLDGLFYSGGSADNRFVSLDNRYTEVLRPPATVSDHGHEVALFRGRLPGDADDKDIRYDPQTKQYYTLKPVWDAHHNRTEERQLITGGEHGAQVENVTIQRRLDDGRTLITDMQTAGGTVLSYRNSFRGSKDYALVDLAHHSLTARNGSLGMDFSLADAKSGHPNVGLAANLDRSTYRVTDVDGREVRDLVSRQYFDLSDAKNPKAKIETPESLGVNDAQHRPLTLTVVREQGFPTGQSLADVVKQGSFTKLPDYYTTKGPDGSAEGHSRVDFDVHLNTSGMSEREREAAYRKVAERITQAHHLGVIDSISGDGTEFEAQLSQMMGFFDGQLGRDGSVDVSYHVDHEGGVSTSRFTYNDNARRLDVADKGSALYVPYVRYVKLPDPNPEALGKEEPGMTGEELKGIRYNRWLAGMRQVTNKSGLFASWGDDNMPNGFMGDANGAYKYHTYGLAGDGKFQTIKVDGRDAGRIQATMDVGFLGLGYVGAAIGNGTRNYVAPAYFNTVGLPYTYLYMWVTGKSKEEAVKMLSAITGGIARGAFESVTDPVFIALTVATWGAGTIPALTLKVLQVVYKGVKTAEEIVKIVKTVEVTIKAVQTLVNLKFAYDMGKGLRETGGQVAHAIESGNPDDAYQASRGVSAFVVGFVAAHGLNEWLQGKSAGIQQDYAKFTTENAPAKPVETKAPTTTETQTQQQPQTQPQT